MHYNTCSKYGTSKCLPLTLKHRFLLWKAIRFQNQNQNQSLWPSSVTFLYFYVQDLVVPSIETIRKEHVNTLSRCLKPLWARSKWWYRHQNMKEGDTYLWPWTFLHPHKRLADDNQWCSICRTFWSYNWRSCPDHGITLRVYLQKTGINESLINRIILI